MASEPTHDGLVSRLRPRKLYVILDVFSRCVVGWMLATRESQTLAEQLIAETCVKQQIKPDQLTGLGLRKHWDSIFS